MSTTQMIDSGRRVYVLSTREYDPTPFVFDDRVTAHEWAEIHLPDKRWHVTDHTVFTRAT
jgi:hypothetical protein